MNREGGQKTNRAHMHHSSVLHGNRAPRGGTVVKKGSSDRHIAERQARTEARRVGQGNELFAWETGKNESRPERHLSGAAAAFPPTCARKRENKSIFTGRRLHSRNSANRRFKVEGWIILDKQTQRGALLL